MGDFKTKEKRLDKLLKDFEKKTEDVNLNFLRQQGVDSLESAYEKASTDVKTFKESLNSGKSLSQLANEEKILKARVANDEAFLNSTDSSFIGKLSSLGLEESEIIQLTKLFSEEIIKAQEYSILDPQKLLISIRELLSNIKNDKFNNGIIELNLSHLPNLNPLKDLDFRREELMKHKRRLDEIPKERIIAQNYEAAQEELKALKKAKAQALDNWHAVIDFNKDQKSSNTWKVDLEQCKGKVSNLKNQLEDNLTAKKKAKKDQEESTELKDKAQGRASKLKDLFDLSLEEMKKNDLSFDSSLLEKRSFEELKLDYDSCMEELESLKEKLVHKQAKQFNLDRAKTDLLVGYKRLYDSERDWKDFLDDYYNKDQLASAVEKAWDVLFVTMSSELSQFVEHVLEVDSLVRSLNRTLKEYQISNLEEFKISLKYSELYHDIQPFLSTEESIFHDADKRQDHWQSFSNVLRKDRSLKISDLFALEIRIKEPGNERAVTIEKLDDQSTGTNYTAKAVILSKLLAAQMSHIRSSSKTHFHYYLDEISSLDESNLSKIIKLGLDEGLVPITAAPKAVVDPLCQPECQVIGLKYDPQKRKTNLVSSQSFSARLTV